MTTVVPKTITFATAKVSVNVAPLAQMLTHRSQFHRKTFISTFPRALSTKRTSECLTPRNQKKDGSFGDIGIRGTGDDGYNNNDGSDRKRELRRMKMIFECKRKELATSRDEKSRAFYGISDDSIWVNVPDALREDMNLLRTYYGDAPAGFLNEGSRQNIRALLLRYVNDFDGDDSGADPSSSNERTIHEVVIRVAQKHGAL